MKESASSIALVNKDIEQIKVDVGRLIVKFDSVEDMLHTGLDEKYITRREYEADIVPLKKFVYGSIGAIITAIIALIFR